MKYIIWTNEIISIELKNSIICFSVPFLIINQTPNEIPGTPGRCTNLVHQKGLDNQDKKWHFFTWAFVVWYQLLELTGPLIKGHLTSSQLKRQASFAEYSLQEK